MNFGRELWRKLQMEILKHGNLKRRKFVCDACGCEFVADIKEYYVYICDGVIILWYAYCPECDAKVTHSEPWEDKNETSF